MQDPTVEIKRVHYGDATLGQISVWQGPVRVCSVKSLELPWKDNRPRVSCIPEGLYKLKWTKSGKFGATWQVMDVPDRKYIRIHAGNFLRQIQGCILPGMAWTHLDDDGVMDIASSRKALGQFEAVLPKDKVLDIVITH